MMKTERENVLEAFEEIMEYAHIGAGEAADVGEVYQDLSTLSDIVRSDLTDPCRSPVIPIVRERLRCMAKQRSSEDMIEDEDDLQDADFQGGYDQMVFEARKAHSELEGAFSQFESGDKNAEND